MNLSLLKDVIISTGFIVNQLQTLVSCTIVAKLFFLN